MKTVHGTNNRILEIDLSTRQSEVISISDSDRKQYIGGKGLALKLLYDRLTPGIDPLGEQNIFIITTGVLIGTGAPNSARFSAVSKSPLTGIITHSSCGGPFGNALKTSGWDGIILKGRSESPLFLVIDSQSVKFEAADSIWGKTTSGTEGYLSKYGKGSLAIGPAGENLVRYANIRSGGRYLGRGGLGAILGSKKVKGIVAKGEEVEISPVDPENFKKYSSRGFKFIKRSIYTHHKYRTMGTLMHMKENNEGNILPVRNFRESSSPEAENISGEYVRRERITGIKSCKNCTILCGHEGNFNSEKTGVPEYETAALLGSNLGIFDIDKISEWNDLCGELGLDTISSGGTLAFVMEASEYGLIDSKLKFGDHSRISETLKNIAYVRGNCAEYAFGSRWLSEKYGGSEFCMQVKGLEISGYDPRGSIGMGLNYAVANRGGCHLSSALFGMEVVLGFLDPGSHKKKAVYVELLENIFVGVNCLHTCQFTIYPFILESLRIRYIPLWMIKFFIRKIPSAAKLFFDLGIYSGLFSTVTGIKMNNRAFLKAGKRTHILERYMNTREGISAADDILPARIMKENSRGPGLDPFPLKKMLRQYYKIRKYDRNGIPEESLLESLGIKNRGAE